MKSLGNYCFLLLFCCLFLLAGCGDDSSTTPGNNDITLANQLAGEGIEMLNGDLQDMSENEDIEINESDDILQETRFDEIEDKFTQALAADADNPMASVGMGILEIVRLNYDDEFWSLVDDFIELDDQRGTHPSLMRSQFELLARSPFIALKCANVYRNDDISIVRIQNIIDDSVIPRLNSSLKHLNNAIALADSNSFFVDTGEELIEIDCGEIYAFRASVYLLRAAFRIINAYNWDMEGMDGSYDWIDETFTEPESPYPYYDDTYPNTAYDYSCDNNNVIIEIHYFYMDEWEYDDMYRNDIMQKTLCHNLQNNNQFGHLKSGYLSNAQNDLMSAIDDINAGIDYIENEDDPQSDDAIKLEYINDLNEQILDDEDNPEFMQDWTGTDDAIAWLQSLVSGSVELTANDEDFTLDLDAFFSGAINDIKDYIPYYHWNDINADWLVLENNWYYVSNYPHNVSFIDMDGNIHDLYTSELIEYYDEFTMSSGYLTNALGDEIGDGEFPYFPDYTFHGIFPGMTREKLNRIFE
jgi:hypothetical protein